MAFIPNHQHVLVHMKLRKPFTTTVEVSNWLTRIVSAVGMEILNGPHSVRCDDLGNEGVTGTIVLSTSHSSIHIWDTTAPAYANFDLYSCKYFTIDDLMPLLLEMDPSFISYTFIDRNISPVAILKSSIIER